MGTSGVNCPYDEENHQGSSWEGEREEEKPEEFVSLEAPDDEGVVLSRTEQNHQVVKANGPKGQHSTTLCWR